MSLLSPPNNVLLLILKLLLFPAATKSEIRTCYQCHNMLLYTGVTGEEDIIKERQASANREYDQTISIMRRCTFEIYGSSKIWMIVLTEQDIHHIICTVETIILLLLLW